MKINGSKQQLWFCAQFCNLDRALWGRLDSAPCGLCWGGLTEDWRIDPGPSTCKYSLEMVRDSWHSTELNVVSLLLLIHSSHMCLGGVFVLGTSAEAVFAFAPPRKFLFPTWGISVSPLAQSLEEWLVLSEWMNGFISQGSDFIPSYIPERVRTIHSHQSCRIATLSRTDTIETIIGIIFTRSKRRSFPQAPKKHNPVLRFQKMMPRMAWKSAPP